MCIHTDGELCVHSCVACRPKEAVAALKKRFSGAGKNFHVVNLTLTVLETCVKNCGHRFHVKIAQKDFLSELVKVINPKVCQESYRIGKLTLRKSLGELNKADCWLVGLI